MRWTHRKIKDEDVVEFVLNSSFVIFLTHSHKSVWRLVLTDFALPSRRNFFKQALHLEFDLTERHVHFFSLNGHEVQCRQRILALLLYVLAFAIHPKVHAFQNTLQKGFQELPLKYWRMMAIGTYLNESAAFLPCLPFTGQGGFGLDWCREVLDYNATSGIPVHGIFDKKLLDASSFLRFAIHARNIIFQELDRAGLHMIDKESYFVCSVIHSLDHVSGGRALSWVWFDCRDGDANMRNFNILARNFFAPVSYWFLPDNRLESHWRDNEFYARLYHRFRKVNPELTSDVTLSMSS